MLIRSWVTGALEPILGSTGPEAGGPRQRVPGSLWVCAIAHVLSLWDYLEDTHTTRREQANGTRAVDYIFKRYIIQMICSIVQCGHETHSPAFIQPSTAYSFSKILIPLFPPGTSSRINATPPYIFTVKLGCDCAFTPGGEALEFMRLKKNFYLPFVQIQVH